MRVSPVCLRVLLGGMIFLAWGGGFGGSSRAADPPAITPPAAAGPVAAGPVAAGPDQAAKPPAETPEAQEKRIARLIEQLGADEFIVRERAQGELSRLGASAFDALYDAQEHPDAEIALRARVLVRSMRVTWLRDDDSPEVKKILRRYQSEDETERMNLVKRLVDLNQHAGVAAVCRMVRFETTDKISKQVALHLIRREAPAEAAERSRLAELIRKSIANSKRPAAEWLRVYAKTMEDPAATVEAWNAIVKKEQEDYSLLPDGSTRELVRDLLRWHAENLLRLGRREPATGLIAQMTEVIGSEEKDLVETMDWLIEQSAWKNAEDLAARQAAIFSGSIDLQYRLGESRRKQGDVAKGEETAEKAFRLNDDNASRHLMAALQLQNRGMFEWSEREYRALTKSDKVESPLDVTARLLLSEMLHDLQRDLDAAKVLKVMVDAFEKEPKLADIPRETSRRDPENIAARMHLFFAQHYAAEKDVKRQMEHLRKAIAKDATDGDVLIAMHRIRTDDAEWKKFTRAAIQTAIEEFRERINELQQEADRAERSGNESHRDSALEFMSTFCNQYAWLVANTEGDFHEALRFSQLSLEIRHGTAGYMDTLAHCYFALKDYANAYKTQRQAVKLEPHSMTMVRALAQFEKALAEKKK